MGQFESRSDPHQKPTTSSLFESRPRTVRTEEAFERAVHAITHITTDLLAELPRRHRPPPTLPPLRRKAAAVTPVDC